MGFINEGDRIKNPEAVMFSLHDLSSQDSYAKESKREFKMKGIFLVFFIAILRLGLSEQIPSILDILLIITCAVLVTEFAFKNVELLNNMINKRGISAIFVFLIIVISAVMIGGIF